MPRLKAFLPTKVHEKKLLDFCDICSILQFNFFNSVRLFDFLYCLQFKAKTHWTQSV